MDKYSHIEGSTPREKMRNAYAQLRAKSSSAFSQNIEPSATPSSAGDIEPSAPLSIPETAPLSVRSNTPPQARAPAPRKTLSERDLEIINKISADIDNEEKSDMEAPGYEAEFERYVSKGKKRAMNTERNEGIKRKVCF